MMYLEKLAVLDAAIRENDPGVYETLRMPAKSRLRDSHPLHEWFAWKDGQKRNEDALLFQLYRFMPYQESQQELRTARLDLLKNPIQAILLIVFAGRTLYCRPLLVTAFGTGYFYDPIRRTVFYWGEECGRRSFASIESFVEFLIDAVTGPAQDSTDDLARMSELSWKYTL